MVDVSNLVTASRRRAEEFFTAGTAHLVAAGGRAGVRHHVLLSIVGVDGSRLGYYRAKVAQERRLARGRRSAGVGHTVARATQFHDFALQTLERSGGAGRWSWSRRAGPAGRPRRWRRTCSPSPRAEPVGRAPDLAGPRVERLPDLVRRVAAPDAGRTVRVVGAAAAGSGLRRSAAAGATAACADGHG